MAEKWRILCIDDDPEILSVLSVTLGMHHEVVTAASGNEALRVIDICEPDFVLCDVRMPGMDGFETVAALRRQAAYRDIPVFFLTAEKGRDAAKKGYESGANLYLYKPFQPMRLLENIDYFTRESGHAIRPKSRTVEEVEALVAAIRRVASKPAASIEPSASPSRVPAPPKSPAPAPPAASRPPMPDAGRPPVAGPRPSAPRELSEKERLEKDKEIYEKERELFEADRRAREREFWKKKYAAIQDFIDQHMAD